MKTVGNIEICDPLEKPGEISSDNLDFNYFKNKTEVMYSIIQAAMLSADGTNTLLPFVWTKTKFFKYVVLRLFFETNSRALNSQGTDYKLEMPTDWEERVLFKFRIGENANFSVTIFEDEDGITVNLKYPTAAGRIVDRGFGYTINVLEDPTIYNSQDFGNLVLAYNEVLSNFGSYFLVPIIVPLSNGMPVRAR